MKLPTLSSPLKLFSPVPAQPAFGLAGAGSTMMFASGGGGEYDPDDDFEQFEEFDDQPEEAPRRPRARRSSPAGGDRGGAGGRQRTSQFQPEERYWTDYLRIALPVVGLLLLIGLLWYWANWLINDEPSTSEPVATQSVGEVITATPTVPVFTQPTGTPPANTAGSPGTAAGEQQTTPPSQSQPGGDNQSGESTTTEPEATEPPEESGAAFSDGETVEVTEELNLRPNPSTDGEPVAQLAVGDRLVITGGPEEGENYTWWEIVTEDGSASGWVVQDFIESTGE